MRKWGLIFLLGIVFVFGMKSIAAAAVLHEFAGGNDDGERPYGYLILSGSTLYGMTEQGGDNDKGVIFSIGTDGSNFTLLHEFAGGNDDGADPIGSLVLSGSTLYGMTLNGGDNDEGVIFSIGTDGSNFTLLHEFAGTGVDGGSPWGSLTLSGSTLYGMTGTGVTQNDGQIFSIGTNGSNFTILHEFLGGASDGADPFSDVLLNNSTLYGMTTQGGDSDRGVVFSIGTDGSNFTLLHEFAGGNDDGAVPYGTLVISNSTLYGMTSEGGDSLGGVVFSIGTNGSNFALLHEFAGGNDDGRVPYGGFVISNSTLYGMTRRGGDSDGGVVFSIGTNGSNFTLLHEFPDVPADGEDPYALLLLGDSTLYGMTRLGGSSNKGVVFSHVLAPTITSFTPGSGGTGTSVTITGTNFTNATAVKFGGTDAASFTVDSNTQITAVVGNGSSGNVTVTTPGGTATSASTFTYIPPPTITSFTPTSGATGATITITGTNFTGATAVKFGGTDAQSYTVDSATQISAVVRNGSTGNITVTTPGGMATSASTFTYIPPPTITSFTPTSGATGTPVTITGTNFNGATAVKFGGTDAQSYAVVSATQITAMVGNGSSGNITVTTPGGTATSASTFTHIPPPTITDFNPKTGSAGTTVVITGTNFTGTEVRFGGTNAAGFTVDSATQITAAVGGGSTGNVTVTTNGGTGTSASIFTYNDDPATLATGTPGSYKVTVTKVEMFNGTDWVTIFTGTAQLDMAAGGTFPGIRDLNLPDGVYSQVRVTFQNAFPVSGTTTYGGTAYYTTATAFFGQANLASTPTTVAGSMEAFTFRNPAWGALNADVTQTYAITPMIVSDTTDYQPTLRFTISNTLLLIGTAGNPSSYYFALNPPTASLVEP